MNFERFKSISNLDFKEVLLKVQTNAIIQSRDKK